MALETDPLDSVPFLLRPRGDAVAAPGRARSSLSPFGFICSVLFALKLRGEEQTRLGSDSSKWEFGAGGSSVPADHVSLCVSECF